MDIKVIVLADRLGKELEPLDQTSCPALLEIAGRSVIEYTLEDLAEAGFKQALVVSVHTELFEKKIRKGGRWGLELEHLLSRGEMRPESALRRAHHEGPALIIRGDVVRGRCVSQFLKAAVETGGECVSGTINGQDAGICFVQGKWSHGADWRALESGPNDVELGDIGFFSLRSLKNLHDANMAAMDETLQGTKLPGRTGDTGITAARQSVDHGARVNNGKAFIGLAAQVGKGVEIKGSVVIAEHSYVDEGASLENCVVMPGTYVGKDVEIRNAIVAGNRLIRVDIDTITEIPDDFLLTSMQKPADGASAISFWDRILAVFLLMISAPLWPIAAILAFINHPSQPLVSSRQVGNRDDGAGTFTRWVWNTNIPVLRNLPGLFPVITGHLCLVGVRPPLANSSAVGHKVAPAGLIGPALLDMDSEATEDEIALGETVYASRLTLGTKLTYMLRGASSLFGRRAWKPSLR